jgi:hypothetical protein
VIQRQADEGILADMPKRKPRDDELTRDTPVKIDLPFDEAARRLVQPRDDQSTSDDEEASDDSE